MGEPMTTEDIAWFALQDQWELFGHPDMGWEYGDNDAKDPEQNWEESND